MPKELKLPKMDPRLKKIFLPLLFVALVAAMLAGVDVAKDREMYREIGRFTLRPYKYGVYLTQEPSGVFYNLSFYDFYYTNPNNEEVRLFSFENEQISKEAQQIANEAFATKITSALSYFNVYDPKATFEKDGSEVYLTTKTDGNKVTITLRDYPLDDVRLNPITMTLSTNEEDYIFDIIGNIYSDQTEEEISDFNKIQEYWINDTRPTNTKIGVKYKEYLFIANRDNNGVIRINLKNQSYSDIFVNKEKMVIEFLMNSNSILEVEVELFDSLQEALRDL